MNFLLDTNVLSALMATRIIPEVASWIATQAADRLFTATICEAEILSGLAILPTGRRRADLTSAAQAMFADDFRGRVWAFDSDAARAYADLLARRRRSGRSTAPLDLMVGAIAHARGAAIVTRNGPDFAGCGLTVVNPWTSR